MPVQKSALKAAIKAAMLAERDKTDNRKRRMIAPNDTRNWQVSMDDPAAIVEGVDDIVQSINIILTTIPGSDPLRPEFGSNVYQYLDKPLPSVLGKIIYEATTAIGRWEP